MAVQRVAKAENTGWAERPRFDPSTWGGQARNLARNDADGMALLVAAGLMVANAAAIGLSLWAGWAELRDLFGAASLLVLGCELLAVALAWILTYARALRSDTQRVRWQTWRQELATERDLDGDGFVGDPQASRTIRVTRGDQVEEVTLDMPARSQAGGPVLVDFGVTAPDLVSFLFEADLQRGLQERNWIGDGVQGYVLPSGQRVTQKMFRELVSGLAERGMAVKSAGRWELDCDPATVAEQLKAAA